MGGKGRLNLLGVSTPEGKATKLLHQQSIEQNIQKFFHYIRFPTHTCSVSTFFLPPVGDSSSSPSFAIAITLQCVQMAPFPFPPLLLPLHPKRWSLPLLRFDRGCVLLNSLISFHDLIPCFPSFFFTHVQYIHRGKRRTSYGGKSKQEEEELTRLSKTATLQN